MHCKSDGEKLARKRFESLWDQYKYNLYPKTSTKKCLPFYRLDKVKEAGAATKDAEFFMSGFRVEAALAEGANVKNVFSVG